MVRRKFGGRAPFLRGRIVNSPVQRASEPKTTRAVQMISKAERSRFAGAWLVVLFLPVALLISSLLLLPQFRSSNATDESANGAGATTGKTASIVVRRSAKLCEHKTFDNQTGRISDADTPCPQDVVLDANGIPVPTGTVRTLNAISKTFGGR
jgi:hypothetical protein